MSKQTAPDNVIEVGYWLTEARTALQGTEGPYGGDSVAWAFAYLTSAVSSVPAAREALNEKLANRQMWPSEGLLDVTNACRSLAKLVGTYPINPMDLDAVEHTIGSAHQKLARMLSRMGYEPITDADFERLVDDEDRNLPGGGGGR